MEEGGRMAQDMDVDVEVAGDVKQRSGAAKQEKKRFD